MNTNYFDKLAYNFQQKIKLYKNTNEVWKQKAYVKALNHLNANKSIIISSVQDINQFKFGKSIHEKCIWLIENNDNLPEIRQMDSNIDIIEDLTSIHNIGIAKARELMSKHGITSISHLRENTHLLNEKQIVGLKYHQDIQQKIPRSEMVQHEIKIKNILKESLTTTDYDCEIVGSYRRGKSESGDIDVIISMKGDAKGIMQKIISYMQYIHYIPHDGVFALGNKKFMGLCKLEEHTWHRRLDILITTPSEYPFAILYFTGSGEFNVRMREHAKSKGYSLNEKMLSKVDSTKKINNVFRDEESIFEFLGVLYLTPEKRCVDEFKLLDNSNNTEK